MLTVKVSPKFQIIIPKLVREKMDIHPGQELQIISFDGRIEYVLLRKISEMRGFFKGIDSTIKRESDRI